MDTMGLLISGKRPIWLHWGGDRGRVRSNRRYLVGRCVGSQVVPHKAKYPHRVMYLPLEFVSLAKSRTVFEHLPRQLHQHRALTTAGAGTAIRAIPARSVPPHPQSRATNMSPDTIGNTAPKTERVCRQRAPSSVPTNVAPAIAAAE